MLLDNPRGLVLKFFIVFNFCEEKCSEWFQLYSSVFSSFFKKVVWCLNIHNEIILVVVLHTVRLGRLFVLRRLLIDDCIFTSFLPVVDCIVWGPAIQKCPNASCYFIAVSLFNCLGYYSSLKNGHTKSLFIKI